MKDRKHLQDWLVSAGVLGSTVLIEKEQTLLRMGPYNILYKRRWEIFEGE
jgi:hypothetical protein